MPSYLVSAKEAFVPTQMYTPPIQSIGEILRIKQGRYDQGYNQVNSVYKSITDAEVLSADNTEKKKQYLDNAEKALTQLSQMDLSQPENVKFGEDIFKPFWEDQDMVREVGLIKNTRKNISVGESMQMNADEKIREGYNSFSIKDLNNQLKEISESTADERKMMSPRSYVKKVDISKEMDAALVNLGIKNASIVEDVNGGGYKVVNQFNQKSVLPLTDFFMNSLSTDARAHLQMMGRLNYRDVYETNLAKTNGDREAAKRMVATDLIQRDADALEKNLIPELDRGAVDAESRIAAIIAERSSQGSDLSTEDVNAINQLKDAAKNYRDKSAGYSKNLATLKDPNSEGYKNEFSIYSTQGNNVFGKHIISQYANGWAKSRANNLASVKIEEDKGWKAIQDVITDRLGLQNKVDIANINNASDEAIAAMKATKTKGKTGVGSDGQTGLGPIYISQAETGNKLVSKAEQFSNLSTTIFNTMAMPTVTLFEKTLSDKTGIGSRTTGKLYQGLMEGKGDRPFFTGEDVKNNSSEYAAFKKAFDENLLTKTPGKKYKWTYNEVFNVINDTTQNFIKSDEGIARIRQGGLNEIATILTAGETYSFIKDDQSRINTEILGNKKYAGYTTSTEDGTTRLKTDAELSGDYSIPMRDAQGRVVNVKVSDIAANKDKLVTTADNGVYVQGSGTTGRTYYSTVAINGKEYTYASGDPKLMSSIQTEGVAGALKIYKGPEYAYIQKLRADYEKDFEAMAPSLKVNTSGNANAFNYGIVGYMSGDNKNLQEAGEVAAQQLFSPENLTARRDKFLGVDKKDLEEGSDFMNVVNAVKNYLPKLAGTNDAVRMDVQGYNPESKSAVYKLRLSNDQIMSALNISKDDMTDGLKKAINKFTSEEFKIVAPNYNNQPGGLINGMTPLESYVRNNGYNSAKYFDDMKMGGFNMKKLANGNFQVKAWYYEYNPQTKALEKKDYKNAGLDEISNDVDVDNVVNGMYSLLSNNYKKTTDAMQVNPPVPKGTGKSITAMTEELKAAGIKIN